MGCETAELGSFCELKIAARAPLSTRDATSAAILAMLLMFSGLGGGGEANFRFGARCDALFGARVKSFWERVLPHSSPG